MTLECNVLGVLAVNYVVFVCFLRYCFGVLFSVTSQSVCILENSVKTSLARYFLVLPVI